MKKIFNVVIFLSILLFLMSGCSSFNLMSGCSSFNNIKFSELKTGENFLLSRDGYYKKISNNYCLDIKLRSKAYLFTVSDEYANIDWDSSLCYGDIILEGHFIKGFYTSDYLVLCEEREDDSLGYIIFDFCNGQIRHFLELDEIHKLLKVDSIQWFVLCNTNKEIKSIK